MRNWRRQKEGQEDVDEGGVTLKLSFRGCLNLGSPSLLFHILSVYIFFFLYLAPFAIYSCFLSTSRLPLFIIPYYGCSAHFFLCMDIFVAYSCFLSSSLLNTLIIPYSVCSVYYFSFVWISLQFILVFSPLFFFPSSVIFLILSVL